MTLVCLNMFVTQRLDVAVIEVGVGGRADATTVVDVCVACGFGFCLIVFAACRLWCRFARL